MLVDISQNKESIGVSFVNTKGKIEVKTFNVNDVCGGFYEYTVCSDTDPQKHPSLKSYSLKGESVKQVPSWKFSNEALREFMLHTIPEQDREQLYAFNELDAFACDIELDLSDDDAEVFPDVNEAKFEICTIQITAPNLNTVILTKDKDRIANASEDAIIVQEKIAEHFKGKGNYEKYPFEVAFVEFDDERSLLKCWYDYLLKYIHFSIWWNSEDFDLPYIENRAKKLGVDFRAGSPTGEYDTRRNYPKHRLTADYMLVCQKFGLDLLPVSSWSLDNISTIVNNVGKVPFEGSFKEMYLGDYNDFQFYGAVDTIVLQLIHQKKKYFSTIMSLSYMAKITMYETWATTKLSAAVIFDSLYSEGRINPYPYKKVPKEEYDGAYVKDPIRKFSNFPSCFDFQALYPNVYMSTNISFENYVCTVTNKEDAKKYMTDPNYFVSVSGNVYMNDKDYTMRRVQHNLTKTRQAYKSLMKDLFKNIESVLLDEVNKRELTI